jgi:hypothetical protein
MNTRSGEIMFLGGKARPVCSADNFTAICEKIVTVGSSAAHNVMGLHGLFLICILNALPLDVSAMIIVVSDGHGLSVYWTRTRQYPVFKEPKPEFPLGWGSGGSVNV